jgi:putative tryptophan/tyrosine transport system substrate-binding protein
MRRREFIAGLGGAAAWPVAARAQQRALSVVGVIAGGSLDTSTKFLTAFRKGLSEFGYVEGQNVSVEYHWLEGQFDRVPALVADLVRRRVAVIATPGPVAAALAAKAATATIPIVFGVNDNPVRLGLVASLSRPGGNLTGMNFFSQEAVSKRLGLLHELAPSARRLAVLLNPSNLGASETTLQEVQDGARIIGLQIDILKASTTGEIEAAFAMMVRERVEALFVAGDSYFISRRVQFATLAARNGIAAAYFAREFVEVGGLMSYGTDVAEMFHQVGAYTGQILKGANPADLPVVQSTRFEFAINLQTARALGIEVPPTLLAQADDVIE